MSVMFVVLMFPSTPHTNAQNMNYSTCIVFDVTIKDTMVNFVFIFSCGGDVRCPDLVSCVVFLAKIWRHPLVQWSGAKYSYGSGGSK